MVAVPKSQVAGDAPVPLIVQAPVPEIFPLTVTPPTALTAFAVLETTGADIVCELVEFWLRVLPAKVRFAEPASV